MAIRRRGGGGGAGWSMLASILGAPQENEYFGAEPGDVPYDMQVDPSKLTAQPYKPDNIWGKMQGSPADRANTASVLGQQRADQHFQQQVEMARQRALVEAAQKAQEREMQFLDAQPGGLLEQQKAAGYRAQIQGDNMQRENAISNLYPTLAAQAGPGPTAAGAPSAVRAQIADLFNQYGQKNVADNGLLNALAAAEKAQADAGAASFTTGKLPESYGLWREGEQATIMGKQIGNEKELAGRPFWGSQSLSSPLVFGDGRFIGINKGREGSPAFGTPGKEGYMPGTPATPDTPFMGAVPAAFQIPGLGSFAPRKTPEAAEYPAGTTFLEPGSKDAKPMKAPAKPGFEEPSILGDFMDYLKAWGGKREDESWAEYEKRKNRK